MAKKILTYIISLFLTVCIFLFCGLLIFLNTAFDRVYVLEKLEQNNYYERVYYDIKDGFGDYIMQSGLEEKDLEGIYTLEQVKADVKKVVYCIYENEPISISTNEMIQELDARINAILAADNRAPGDEEKKAIKEFEDTIAEVYNNNIVFSEKYVNSILEQFDRIQSLLDQVTIFIPLVIIALVGIIAWINRNAMEVLKAVGTALLASGVLSIMVKFLLETRIQNILFLSAAFSKVVVSLMNSILELFFISGIGMCIAGLILIVVGVLKEKNGGN